MPTFNDTLNYLNTVLLQQGQEAPPYPDDVKWVIRDQLLELTKVFPTLAIKLSEFHSNDGRVLHIFKVDGTIPMHYQGSKYNIPILIWVTERYPYAPPLLYVTPTPNMIVRAGHPFVDPNGQVSSQSICNWRYPTSNLVDMTLELSHMCGADPPLYSKPPGYVPPPSTIPGTTAQPPPGYPNSGLQPPQQPPQQQAQQQPPPPPPAFPPPQPPYCAPGSFGAGYGSAYPGISGASASGMHIPQGSSGSGPSVSGQSGGMFYPGVSGTSASGMQNASPGQWSPLSAGMKPPSAAGASVSGQSTSGAPASGSGPAGPGPGGGAGAAAAAAGIGAGIGAVMGGLGSMVFGGLGAHHSSSHPPPPPPPPPPPSPPRVSKEELEQPFRVLAVDALASRLHAAETAFASYAVEAMSSELDVQRQLNERRQALQALHSSLTSERHSTEAVVAELAAKTAALRTWLERNEPKAAAWDPSMQPASSMFVPADELSRQALSTQAEDLALEDSVLMLDRLLFTGQLPLDTYLKQVRSLERRQFFARARGLKVAAIQQQQALQGGRPPPPPLPTSTGGPYPAMGPSMSGPTSAAAAAAAAYAYPQRANGGLTAYPAMHGDASRGAGAAGSASGRPSSDMQSNPLSAR